MSDAEPLAPRPLTSGEVADLLGVKQSTVYSYVSRGLLNSRRIDGSRSTFFDVKEVQEFADQGQKRRMHNEPLGFTSAITNIVDGRPYYRGHSVLDLAVCNTFEEVLHLLWRDDLKTEDADESRVRTAVDARRLDQMLAVLPDDLVPLDRLRVVVPLAGILDPMRHDLQPRAVLRAGQSLLRTLVEALPNQQPHCDVPLPLRGGRLVASWTLASELWRRFATVPPTEGLLSALNAALVVTADHDLASPSTIAARISAAGGGSVYSAVGAALDAGSGPVQAASSLAIETYLASLGSFGSVNEMLSNRLWHGHEIPGFGHRLYPDGDPRADLLLRLLVDSVPGSERAGQVSELVNIQRDRGIPPPNIGFAIASLAYVSHMVPGAGGAIFTIARAGGWIAHASEQYRSGDELPRQRSVYVGREPDGASAG